MKKQCLKTALSVLGISALLTGSIFYSTAAEKKDLDWLQKISTEVQQAMSVSSGNDLIPVFLFKQDYDRQEMKAKVLAEKGYDVAVYETPERFEAEIQTRIAQEMIDKVGVQEASRKVLPQSQLTASGAHTTAAGEPLLVQGVSLIDRAVIYEIQNYVAAKRSIIRELCSEINNQFLEQKVPLNRKIFYNSKYSTTIALEATKSEIERYAKDPLVESIELYEDKPLESYMNIAPNQIGADSSSGTKSNSYNSGSGYTGYGINVGMIEANGGHPNSGSPQLSSRNSSGYIRNCGTLDGASVTTDHATMVASVLMGQAVTVNGITYEGIAPHITLYHIGVYSSTQLLNAIQYFYTYNINLVNCSAGVSGNSIYTSLDQEIDKILSEGNMTFVQAAGNKQQPDGTWDLSVSSPGKAYNVITVANAVTKSSQTVASVTPYAINSSSGYIHASYLTNKPDIAAPGTNIYYVKSAGTVASGTGNSYSAPMVTGVIAQMMQARTALITKPILIKAKLAMAADYDKISSANNAQEANSKLRKKSGAGLLNAKKAIDAALDTTNYRSNSFVLSTVTDGTTVTCGSIFAQGGRKIRVALAFENPQNTLIRSATDVSNLDIRLYNTAGTLVASASSSKNNLEVLEYTVPYAGTFTVEVIMTRHVPTTAYKVQYYSAAWEVY